MEISEEELTSRLAEAEERGRQRGYAVVRDICDTLGVDHARDESAEGALRRRDDRIRAETLAAAAEWLRDEARELRCLAEADPQHQPGADALARALEAARQEGRATEAADVWIRHLREAGPEAIARAKAEGARAALESLIAETPHIVMPHPCPPTRVIPVRVIEERAAAIPGDGSWLASACAEAVNALLDEYVISPKRFMERVLERARQLRERGRVP